MLGILTIAILFILYILYIYFRDKDRTYYYENVYPVFHSDEVDKKKDYFLKKYGLDFFEWNTYNNWVKSGRKKRSRK